MIAKDDSLIAYGSCKPQDRLMQILKSWVDFGMPDASAFNLKVYLRDVPLVAGDRQWITKRDHSQFLWSLPT